MSLTRESVFSLASIEASWKKVKQGGSSPGRDGMTKGEVEETAWFLFPELSDSAIAGKRRVVPGVRVDKKKEGGGLRTLYIASFRDRILMRCLATAVITLLSPWLHDASHAYRPGRSYRTAIEAAQEQGNWNGCWRADIAQCFAMMKPEMAWPTLLASGCPQWVVIEIGEMLQDLAGDCSGLPEGCPLSPLLCAAGLDPLDRRMSRLGPWIRYADDILAWGIDSLAQTYEALDSLGLRLNQTKSKSLADAEFKWLNHDLREPLAMPNQGVSNRTQLMEGRVILL